MAGAFARRGRTLMRLVTFLAIIVVVATVVAAFAEDRRLGSTANSPSRNEIVIRPPALIPSPRAKWAAAPKTSSADRHAAEFLRWKDQHAASTRR